jgi:HYDIN/CFA65/VesB-like, Ig-like domain
MKRLILTIALFAAAAAPTAAAESPVLKLSPEQLNFGTRPVGTETIKSATITNRSDSPLLITFDIVSMPDDFGFEAPGFTCPPAGGFILAPGESCKATAAFRPTEFFAGDRQTAAVRVVASDPSNPGAVLGSELLTLSGTGK